MRHSEQVCPEQTGEIGQSFDALSLRRSFNRDPESAATWTLSTCVTRCWQTTAGSACGRHGDSLRRTRAPRREVAGIEHCKGNASWRQPRSGSRLNDRAAIVTSQKLVQPVNRPTLRWTATEPGA